MSDDIDDDGGNYGGSGDGCDDGDNACNDISYGGDDNVDYDDDLGYGDTLAPD